MKCLILKFPAYHFVLKNYGFSETTFLSWGIFHSGGGDSGPTGLVWLCATSCSTCYCTCTASPPLLCALHLPFWKSKQPFLRYQIFLTKTNAYVYNSSLTRQLCTISSTVFCKLSCWLFSAPHCLSNTKRVLHYKSFQSGLASTKPTQMLLPKPLQPVQAKSGRLHS